jgi:hypothetical protein
MLTFGVMGAGMSWFFQGNDWFKHRKPAASQNQAILLQALIWH